ncbi:ABC transporter permease [Candidatus Bathyarchaeota archaeon]|nr:ABC transporter permease [Candidatus Bathyarchaeota archaeon]MBS7628173.1 ABC transporter permease [Candidatus Bathyarchaeota archaeon]
MINPWLLILTILVVAPTFSTLGCFVSVVIKEVFEAQTLANLFRFPMIFLSGVFLSITSMPLPAQLVAISSPLLSRRWIAICHLR